MIELKRIVNEEIALIELLKDEENLDISEFIENSKIIQTNLEKEALKLMLNGPYDASNCYLDINSGAGGTEACDWALMLYRMYIRYCEDKNYQVEIIDYQAGDEAGLKSASLKITGPHAYGYLKSEKGVHRLVRISPFDANKKRHTSFSSVDVVPILEHDDNLEILDKDLKIDVYRSSGAGGQHVNTTDSAVRITHLPTKTVVTSQQNRSQIKNKEAALSILRNKLMHLKQEQEAEKLNKIQGTQKNVEFGNQIRSYVMQPYTMVKDHRTNYEESDVNKVLDGNIDNFIDAYLKQEK